LEIHVPVEYSEPDMPVIHNDLCLIRYEKYKMGDKVMSLSTTKYYFTIVLVILSILFAVPSGIRTYESSKINKLPDSHVMPDQTAYNALMLIPQSGDYYKNANSGVKIDDFEDTKLWETDNASIESETGLYLEGTQSIRVTTSATAGSITKRIILNFSSGDGISFWAYIPDETTISFINVYLTSEKDKINGKFSKYFIASLGNFRLVQGWNGINIPKSAFENRGDSWDNQMAQIRISIVPQKGATTSVIFDNMRFNVNGRPKAIVTFDDGWGSVYTKAYPILTNNNQKATTFIITGSVGHGRNYMNISELTALYNSGWDVSSHTVNHTDLTKLSEPRMRTEINDSYDWLVTHGFKASAKFFAYPYGTYNNRTITALKEKGYVLARTLKDDEMSDSFNIYQGDSLYELKAIELTNTTTDGQIRGYIDAAVNTNSTVIFVIHHIADSDTSVKTNILTSTLEKMSDYLKSKQAQIDVVTLGDYWNGISSNPRPKPEPVVTEIKTEQQHINGFASYRDLRTLIDTTIAAKPKCERIRLLHYLIPTNNVTYDIYIDSVIKRTAENYDYSSPEEMWNTCTKNGYDMGDNATIKTFVIDNHTVMTN
jgi:peptidoglycan/xylan/chitin deacetylase (PgdA/CDA1 family)